jgi:hypothetical protein
LGVETGNGPLGFPCLFLSRQHAADSFGVANKKGQEVEPVWMCEPIVSSFTFECVPNQTLICEDVLFASDVSTKSHYKRSHPNNKGAERVGEIIIDFTFLITDGLIQPIDPGVDAEGNRIGKRHYRVDYTLFIKVVDRDLQCFAIFQGKVMQKCKINIASAFRPGVK